MRGVQDADEGAGMKTETKLTIVPADQEDNEEFGSADEAIVLLPEIVKELDATWEESEDAPPET